MMTKVKKKTLKKINSVVKKYFKIHSILPQIFVTTVAELRCKTNHALEIRLKLIHLTKIEKKLQIFLNRVVDLQSSQLNRITL
jgi:hypothetical protein